MDWVEICLDGEFLWCDIEVISRETMMVSKYLLNEAMGQYEGDGEYFSIEARHIFRIITHEEWMEMVADSTYGGPYER
jgi:hypothetical protein